MRYEKPLAPIKDKKTKAARILDITIKIGLLSAVSTLLLTNILPFLWQYKAKDKALYSKLFTIRSQIKDSLPEDNYELENKKRDIVNRIYDLHLKSIRNWIWDPGARISIVLLNDRQNDIKNWIFPMLTLHKMQEKISPIKATLKEALEWRYKHIKKIIFVNWKNLEQILREKNKEQLERKSSILWVFLDVPKDQLKAEIKWKDDFTLPYLIASF